MMSLTSRFLASEIQWMKNSFTEIGKAGVRANWREKSRFNFEYTMVEIFLRYYSGDIKELVKYKGLWLEILVENSLI